VCAFCHTPYPITGPGQPTPRFTRSVPAPRASAAITASGDPRIAMARRSRAKRWSFIGALAAITVGTYFATREQVIPVGVAIPNLIAGPMSQGDANGILKTVNGSAQVEEKDGELTVKIPAATFPERRIGQLALAQQYARAVEITSGRKRAIIFLDPAGVRFARADSVKGVTMSR
jgi:hypothetical protein